MVLTQLQAMLSELYALDVAYDVDDFLVTDGRFADALDVDGRRIDEKLLIVEDRGGAVHRYQVTETTIVHAADARVAVETRTDRLTLVTCWPFDAIRSGGDLRYAVVAERAAGP